MAGGRDGDRARGAVSEELATERVVGVDADLDLLFAQVRALRELADDPDKTRDSPRVYAFSIRWGAMMFGRLERLAYYHSQGRLTPEEQTRYNTLRADLRAAVPLLERLGLARPAVPLDDTDPARGSEP